MKLKVNTMRLIFTVVLCLLGGTVLSEEADAPRAKIHSGVIEGVNEDGINVFRAIPFAAPPIGELRWRAPQSVAAWPGIRHAKNFGAICPQSNRGQRLESEDCLTLNVWARPGADNLPVMLWIHGGANIVGSGIINGANFARDDVVLVSMNYRLGLFGVFAHPDLTRAAETAGEATGNFGVMDQIAALKWIKHNIANFGGDPGRVTIFGVSAGGTHVNNLMVSPRAKGLFHRAIAQSGANGLTVSRSLSDFDRVAVAFTKENAAGSIERLKAMTWRDLYEPFPARVGFQTFVDGEVLTDHVPEIFRRGEQNDVPYIGGANSYEGSLASAIPIPAFTVAMNQNIEAVVEAYDRPREDEMLPLLFYGDALFVAPTRYLGARMDMVKSGGWTYRMDYVWEAFLGKVPGTSHGAEVPYVFDILGAFNLNERLASQLGIPAGRYEPTEKDHDTARVMHQYWVQFAKSGDPNGKNLPRWPAYTSANANTLLISNGGTGVKEALREKQLDLVESIGLKRLEGGQ